MELAMNFYLYEFTIILSFILLTVISGVLFFMPELIKAINKLYVDNKIKRIKLFLYRMGFLLLILLIFCLIFRYIN